MKLTGTAAAAVISANALPLGTLVYGDSIERVRKYRDWVTDRGDYYVVIIPAYKVLANESFDKPVLAAFGEGATMRGCVVNGFMNLLGKRGFSLLETRIDAEKIAFARPRASLELLPGCARGNLVGCHFVGGGVRFTPMSGDVSKMLQGAIDGLSHDRSGKAVIEMAAGVYGLNRFS